MVRRKLRGLRGAEGRAVPEEAVIGFAVDGEKRAVGGWFRLKLHGGFFHFGNEFGQPTTVQIVFRIDVLPELGRQPVRGAVDPVARFDQVGVQAIQLPVVLDFLHVGQVQHVPEHSLQFVLPGGVHQKLPKRRKTAPLIRLHNLVLLAKHIVQKAAFRELGTDLVLPHLLVKVAKILLHLPEIGQQPPGGFFEQTVPVANSGGIIRHELPRPNAPDFGVNALLLTFEFGQPGGLVVGRVLGNFFEQVEDVKQPRLGPHKFGLRQFVQPSECPFSSGRQFVGRFVGTGFVVPAQKLIFHPLLDILFSPASVLFCPVVEVEKPVGQTGVEFAAGASGAVGASERIEQKGNDKRSRFFT